MTFNKVLFVLSFAFISNALAAIPSYIHVCKRTDPKLSECILKSIEALKPKLVKGIPELDVPPLEPLKLDLVAKHGGRSLKLVGNDFVVRGASNWEVDELKVDLPNNSFLVKLRFPKMIIDAMYEVTGKILSLSLHGKGPVQVIADDIDGNAIIKAERVKKDGNEYFSVTSFDLKMNLKNFELKLSKGFFKDPAITDAVNAAIHENKREIINIVKPRVEETVKEVLLEIASKITRHFTYEELFPAK